MLRTFNISNIQWNFDTGTLTNGEFEALGGTIPPSEETVALDIPEYASDKEIYKTIRDWLEKYYDCSVISFDYKEEKELTPEDKIEKIKEAINRYFERDPWTDERNHSYDDALTSQEVIDIIVEILK